MAYINPIATGLEIGKGEAQVIDSMSVMKDSIAMKEKAKAAALADKEKKEKKLLDSIVDIDSSKVFKRDLPLYNQKWGEYRDFIKNNHAALQNPAQNVDIYHEKKRIEGSLLQFVGSSTEAAKQDLEYQRLKLDNPKIIDKNNLHESWSKEGGNFNTPLSFLSRQVDPLAKFLSDYQGTAIKTTDEDWKYENKEGVTTSNKGTSETQWLETYGAKYDNDQEFQQSATEAYEQAGGEENTGFANPRDYAMAEALKLRPVVATATTRVQDNNFNFSGGFGTPKGLNVSSDIFQSTTMVDKESKTSGKRRVVFTQKNGSEMKPMNVKLQGKVKNEAGEDVTEKYKDGLEGAKIESIVEIKGGKNPEYEIYYSVDKKSNLIALREQKEEIESRQNLADRPGPDLGGFLGSSRKTFDAETKKNQKEMDALTLKIEAEELRMKGGNFDIIRVPIDKTTNIADIESNLGYDNGTFYDKIPNYLTTYGEASNNEEDPAGIFK